MIAIRDPSAISAEKRREALIVGCALIITWACGVLWAGLMFKGVC
jgi:hypothetical protein